MDLFHIIIIVIFLTTITAFVSLSKFLRCGVDLSMFIYLGEAKVKALKSCVELCKNLEKRSDEEVSLVLFPANLHRFFLNSCKIPGGGVTSITWS